MAGTAGRPAPTAALFAVDPRPVEAFRIVTALAVREVPGAQFAGITQGLHHSFRTIAPTDDVVSVADEIQYALCSGPCVDAILHHRTFATGDLPHDERWPEFGRRAYESTRVLSMLSFRLFIEGQSELIAGLNLYSRSTTAFDDTSHALGLILATHGALAASAALAHGRTPTTSSLPCRTAGRSGSPSGCS